jgi:hypothetical protein
VTKQKFVGTNKEEFNQVPRISQPINIDGSLHKMKYDKEFNLSEKEKIIWNDGSNLNMLEEYNDLEGCYPIYEPKDVKEAVRLLKENLNKMYEENISFYVAELEEIRSIIDKIFGSKLI